MLKRFSIIALLAIAGCSSDRDPNLNQPPELVSPRIVVSVAEEGTATIDATGRDPLGGTLTYAITTQPTHGVIAGAGPIYTYKATPNYTGTDTLTIKLTNEVGSVTVPVDITVTNVDDAPTGGDQALTVDEHQALMITLAAVDIDNAVGQLGFVIATPPAHGILTGRAPHLTYTPDLLFFGADAFQYTVTDGTLSSSSYTVSITVNHVVTCGDGIVDPTEECDLGDGNSNNGACTKACKIATCGDGLVEIGIEQCDNGLLNSDNGACTASCKEATCGDGLVQTGVEQCDNGILNSNTGACTQACAVATCGDGFVETGIEQCDNGPLNNDNGACTAACKEATCGDGLVQIGVEQCDDGNQSNNDACLNTCAIATCGDGFVELGVEQCDDGNLSNNDACLNTCQIATCGDGFVFTGFEQCDDGNKSNNDACLNTCVSAFCGDGFVRLGVEQCDDANNSNNDACLNTCAVATCGDGFVELGLEQCDLGVNNNNNGGCLTSCKEATCGDGFVQTGVEQCDQGNSNSNTGACLLSCASATCGDGFVETGVEQCDNGNLNSNTGACLLSCKAASCGDGFVRAGFEQCDQGNSNSNTGACLLSCNNASCGDGFVETGVEQCDQGALNSNTGTCVTTCQAAVCGDGFVEAGVEDCDDGNTNNDDTCNNNCKVPTCGDGIVEFSNSEECDDGNNISGDGCDANCLAETYTTTSPALLSSSLNCNTGVATSTHKVAADTDGRIYAVFMCGSSGFFVVSTDRGQTFSSPFDLSAGVGSAGGELQIAQIAVATGEVNVGTLTQTGVVYAAMLSTSGQVSLRESTDFGSTWSPLIPMGTASNTSTGLSLLAFNSDVFVAFESAGGVSVRHSTDQGGIFPPAVIVPLTTADFDLIYDTHLHTVGVVASSPPSFRILLSSDGGKTFASEVNPPGQEFFSDWALSNGQIFVSGTNIGLLGNSTQLYVIPTTAPTTSTPVNGLPQVSTLQSRSLAADNVGNAYVASTLNVGGTVGGVRLDRLPFNTTTFDTGRTLSATGTQPSVGPLPGDNGAVVIYTEGTQVWATVQSYATP